MIADGRSLEQGVYLFFVRTRLSRRPFSSFLTAIYSNRVESQAFLSNRAKKRVVIA